MPSEHSPNSLETRPTRVPPLGRRGEGWVVLQALAILGVVGLSVAAPSLSAAPGGIVRAVAGFAVVAAGAALSALGVTGLRGALTPLPHPRAGAKLRRSGIYGLVRHPIYGGLLLVAAGWSLAAAPLALLPTAALAIVFDLKSRREEVWLASAYPEYDGYRSVTRRRFIPWLL